MASQDTTEGAGGDVESGRVLSSAPMALPGAQSLSWELGELVTDDDEATELARLEHATRNAGLTVYGVRSTCVFAFRSPVGRRSYYELPKATLDDVLAGPLRDGTWQITTADDSVVDALLLRQSE